jgi:hypothetical protein
VAAFDLAFTPRADVPCAALNAYPGIDRPIFRIDLRRRFTSWNNRYVDGLLRRGRRYFRGSRWPCNSRDFRERNPHLEHSNLPPRAAAATSTLILILVSSMAALIHQPLAILGIEILLFAVCCWLLEASSARKSIASQRPRFEGGCGDGARTSPGPSIYHRGNHAAHRSRPRALLDRRCSHYHLHRFHGERAGALGGDFALKPIDPARAKSSTRSGSRELRPVVAGKNRNRLSS